MVEVIELWLGWPPHRDFVSGCLQTQLEQGRGKLIWSRVTVGEEDSDVQVAMEMLVLAKIREVVSKPL